METSTGFISDKLLASIELDPNREVADANRDNNYFPPKFEPSRFQLYKSAGRERRRGGEGENPMQVAKRREEEAAKKKEAAEKEAAAKEAADKATPRPMQKTTMRRNLPQFPVVGEAKKEDSSTETTSK